MYVNGKRLLININNRLKQTQTNLQKSLKKLSSGLRINSAADDAAGLAISQKLLALSRGSQMAFRNVQDAGSMVNVADAAMQDITNVIQRIRELTVQAMNGTNTELEQVQLNPLTTADTIMVQNEIDELKKNLNDLVKHTEFNQSKLLTNTQPGEYIFEDRSAEKLIHMSEVPKKNFVNEYKNLMDYNSLYDLAPVNNNNNYTTTKLIYTYPAEPQSYVGSTVVDYRPLWSVDGQSIVFTSSRDGESYVVPADGSAAPVLNTSLVTTVTPRDTSSNGLMKLKVSGSYLNLEIRDDLASDWTVLKSYEYNYNYEGYSFSPSVDELGNTSFVFSDARGNLTKINVNINERSITGEPEYLINTDDTLNLPPANNTLTLTSAPNLYRMNTDRASLQIEKVTDSGVSKLTYWDGNGTAPVGGYYTVSGDKVTFYGEAIIGNEPGDDGQDYYQISHVADGTQNEIYTASIPSGAEIYNMHGENGPRSMNIRVGSKTITQAQLLVARPEDVEGTNGVYVDETNGRIEFYGDLRPAYNESVYIDYINDVDGRNQIPTYYVSTAIDTYNLTDPDLRTNRSLRVYVGDSEIAYDATKTNGYTYDPVTGRISLYGNARPDLPSNQEIRFEYVSDTSYSNTTKDVYGIPLLRRPEIYNLDSTDSPHSIRVYRNGTEEILYSASDGFQYNESTNTIELYGASRPNVGDTYKVEMVVGTGASFTDALVEIPLTYKPETYGIADPLIPSTFRVLVDGVEVNYDTDKTNGYFYNNQTNKIELYGDARPDASNTYSPDVRVYYVFENSAVSVGNNTYDFQLSSNTLDYGVVSQSGPRAIRIYQNGVEIPYDVTNGYTYDPVTKRLSLHGTYRPDKDDSAGKYLVYSINAEYLKAGIPQGSYIYKVELNGQEIQETEDSAGNGYFFNGQYVEIVGNIRPDITNNTDEINLNVWYSDSFEISLDKNAPGFFYNNYCDHGKGSALIDAEIDPTNLSVFLDDNVLSSDQYFFNGTEIMLNREKLSLDIGSHKLSVDYLVRQSIGYEANKFTFQVGANVGQTLNVEIQSFDNMLRDTNIICVRTYEDAKKGLQVIDKALDFVLRQRGSIGAIQNTLERIATNLSVIEENTISSLSRIEDTDMAQEIMNQTKSSIFAQAAQSLLVHANQQSQDVLQLLK